MTLELTVVNTPSVSGVPAADTLPVLALRALQMERATGSWEINLLVTDDAGIQEMHREFMNLDSPTDIMTFPFDDDAGMAPQGVTSSGGDVVISLETATINAAEAGWPLEREVQFLLLHGVLHLLGWDDVTPERREAMLGRQQAILDDWLRHAG